MESPSSGNEMHKRHELTDLALNFLIKTADMLKAEMGPNPERLQQSMWMVSSGTGNMQSKNFSRLIFNGDDAYGINYSKIKNIDFPEKKQLNEALDDVTQSCRGVMFSSLDSQLVFKWLKLPNPFLFEEPFITYLIDEFLDVVLDHKIIMKSLTAISGINSNNLLIELDRSINIHQISKKELWEFGDIKNFRQFLSPISIPSEDWMILEIKLQCDIPKVFSIEEVWAIRDAVFASLRLISSGSFQIIDLGSSFNYIAQGEFKSQNILRLSKGRCERSFSLDAEMITKLQEYWPSMRKIMESDSHYLKLPAQRLFDGGERKMEENAILDYAIGLERLLTAGIKNELSYRFSLRGATILGLDGGNKRLFFKDLKNFYDLRSSIIHGSTELKASELSTACSIGENCLRKIWWWFFTNSFTEAKKGLKMGTDKIDDIILSNLVPAEEERMKEGF